MSPADAAHRRELLIQHQAAATKLGCALLDVDDDTEAGHLVWGWYDRSVSSRGVRAGQRVWVRTMTEHTDWTDWAFWTGNETANKIRGVPRPYLLDAVETRTAERRFRTEVMTYVEATPASTMPAATTAPVIDEAWLDQLRDALEALASTVTERATWTQEEVTQRLREYFGDRIDPRVDRWVASHCDLHWANLTAPELVILDWEQWGLAPHGYDVATLYCHSLAVPETATAIRGRFGDILDTDDGRRAQLLAISRMLNRTRMGDYTDLVVPLHRLADSVLGVR